MITAIRKRLRGDEDGMTLVAVMGTMFVVTAFLLVSLALALKGSPAARKDQDSKASVAAAQAGLEDFMSRMTRNEGYWRTTDPANQAFTATGVSLGAESTYRYEVVEKPSVANGGVVKVRSTGTVRGVSRTLNATLRPGTFLKYVYFTDKEDLSPTYTGSTSTYCTMRWWEGRSSSPCTEIQFGGGDTIQGKGHTNDTPYISDVNFTQPFTTATMTSSGAPCTGSGCYRKATTYPSFNGGYVPSYSKLIQIPQSNATIRETAMTLGCVYYGATHIKFTGSTMSVLSPGTKTANRPECLPSPGSSTWQTGIPIPEAIYVADYTGSTACTQTVQQSLGFPRAATSTQGAEYGGVGSSTNRLKPDYSCAKGTAYVQGSMGGAATLSTSQDIVITADLTYTTNPQTTPSASNVLGLVPQNSVWVYHPVWYSSYYQRYYDYSGFTPVNNIQAAILTVTDSFIVQNYNKGGDLGTLNVLGSLAQQYRGTVGTGVGSSGQTGYIKNYVYDERFGTAALSPPHFLKPANAPWQFDNISDG